ncbi:hypothetical protein PN613_00120 [Parabacteroides distasonis]|uniref:hypothetical protein n=1 Tax=Parabacteroides distasonis TaxID=823 RepID=UPI0018973126|nr:hypothetical protein [Parabacteroides distasonis]MDB8994766.1 hypothetical protein [Parabacteroides distasonis]MDB9069652.1 hypothetical protein [Parabacteroides distasonis]
MEANDFIKYCHTLLQIISIPMDISKLHGEQNIMILHYLQLEGFMNLSVQENGIMFSFGADDKNIYLIKSDEKVLLEPSIYYEDGEFFLKDSSIFLLTQLAIWVSKKSPYTYSCKQYQYIKVRELFPVWFDGDFYLYTIRFNLENNSFVLRKGDSLLTFVASEPNTLDILLQAANIKKETPKQKSPQHNVFEFDLSGTKVNVELAYSPNSPQTEIDKWLSILKSEELDKMKIRLSKKLTKDVFSQTDNVSKNDLMEQTNLLYGKSIEKIIVDKGYITIIFLAPNVLPDYVINCQLNKRLSIIDYYLE